MGELSNNTREFLRFISNPLNAFSVQTVYKANKVVFERVDLYLDFVLSINQLLQDTYLGDDICTPEVQKQHFDWVWKKVCNDFTSENIFLQDNQQVYEYMRYFFNNAFYMLPEEDKNSLHKMNSVERVWVNLFDYKQLKKSSELDIFIDVWDLFEKSYKKSA